MARTYRVTLKSPDGTTMFVGTVVAEEIVEVPMKDKPSPSPNGSRPDPGERMTDPQRRYLFRLLAAQNVTGKPAEEHLKRHFTVQSLTEISRQAASEYIDHLVKDRHDAAS